MSISINKVEIACSVSQRESIIGVSVGMLVTFTELGLHSGVTAISFTLITGEGIIISDAMDFLGLGVVVALCCCCSIGKSMCKG